MYFVLLCATLFEEYRGQLTCALSHAESTYLPTNLIQWPPPVAQHNKGGAVVTHLDAVTITVIICAYDLCKLQRVFAHGYMEYNTVSPPSYTCINTKKLGHNNHNCINHTMGCLWPGNSTLGSVNVQCG